MWLERLFSRRWAPHLLIVLITTLVWGQSVTFDFVWDDAQLIQELQSIRSFNHIPEMFYRLDAQSSYPEGFKLFRPLRAAFCAVLYALPGKAEPQPWIFHVANLAWHAATAMMFYAVALLLFRKQFPEKEEIRLKLFALLIAIAFTVHPVVSEVVCWAKSMDDAMAAVFTLAAAYSLLTWRDDKQPVWAALIWFTLAIYSKISAVPFAIMVFFLFLLVHKLSPREAVRKTVPFLAVAFFFMVHRHLVIGQSNQTAPISGTYAQTLVDMFPVAPKYLRLLCGLPPFYIDYSFMPGHHAIFSTPVLCGMLIVLIAVGTTVFCLRKPQFAVHALGLLWIAAFLLPVSNLLPMMQYMAERFLYLPLLGWLLVLGAVGIRMPRWQVSSTVLAAGSLAWALVAWDRSFIWTDELTLFVQSSQQGVRIARVEENAVAAIFKQPQVQRIFKLDRAGHRLLMVTTPTPEANAAALHTLSEGHRLFPADPNIASGMGILFAMSGQFEQALPFFEQAAERAPANPTYWANLAQVCLSAKRFGKARDSVTKAVALDPKNSGVWRTASALYWQTEDFEEALAAFQRLHELEPGDPQHEYWIRQARLKLHPATN